MSKNSIGGFFVNLGLNIDKHSFETGNKYIDGLGNGFSKVAGLARNAAVVMATTAIAGGTLSSAEMKMAAIFGVATEKLDVWHAAAKIAGVSAEGLMNSMGKLAGVLNHRYNGAGLEQYAKQLSYLGMNVADLLDLDAADAYQKIIETALKQVEDNPDNKVQITAKIGDILGGDGQGFLTELIRKRIGIDDFLNGAASTQYQTEEGKNKGADFIAEVRTFSETIKSLSRVFGDELGGELIPYLKDLNAWFREYGPDIVASLKKIAESIGGVAEAGKDIKEFFEKFKESREEGKTIRESIQDASNTPRIRAKIDAQNRQIDIQEEITNLWEKKNGISETPLLFKGLKAVWKNYKGEKLKFDELPLELQELIEAHGGKKNFSYIQDGIIRPNGQVTQVAPDDWVFAARNLGDLAQAFTPQENKITGEVKRITNENKTFSHESNIFYNENETFVTDKDLFKPFDLNGLLQNFVKAMSANANTGNAQFSIVQNFTINGAKDTAQSIKQQAFNGTKSALQESMNMSGRRLLMMSGTL